MNASHRPPTRTCALGADLVSVVVHRVPRGHPAVLSQRRDRGRGDRLSGNGARPGDRGAGQDRRTTEGRLMSKIRLGIQTFARDMHESVPLAITFVIALL